MQLLVWSFKDVQYCPNCGVSHLAWRGKGHDVCGCCRVQWSEPKTKNKCRKICVKNLRE